MEETEEVGFDDVYEHAMARIYASTEVYVSSCSRKAISEMENSFDWSRHYVLPSPTCDFIKGCILNGEYEDVIGVSRCGEKHCELFTVVIGTMLDSGKRRMLMREFLPILISIAGLNRFIDIEIDGDDAFVVSDGFEGLGNKAFRILVP